MDMSKPRHSQHDAKLTQTHTVGGNIYTYAVVKHHEFHWIFFSFFTYETRQCTHNVLNFYSDISFVSSSRSSVRVRSASVEKRDDYSTKQNVCVCVRLFPVRAIVVNWYLGILVCHWPVVCAIFVFHSEFWICLSRTATHARASM